MFDRKWRNAHIRRHPCRAQPLDAPPKFITQPTRQLLLLRLFRTIPSQISINIRATGRANHKRQHTSGSRMTSTITSTRFDEAVKLVCARDIHQTLWLAQTPAHDRLRVSYSTTSNFSDSALPAILFCVPMFGSRYYTVDIDHLAVSSGVRVICVDRYSNPTAQFVQL